MSIFTKVDKSRARNPDEEFEYLVNKRDKYGNFFTCDVHPSKVKTHRISADRIDKKLETLCNSAEFLDYNPLHFTPLDGITPET